MQSNFYHLKIPKEIIKQYGNTKSKTLLVLAYLYFHATPEKYIYTSIDCLCLELNLSTKSHGERRSQNIIKDILSQLIENNVISLIDMDGYTSIDDLKNNQLFKLSLNTESPWINSESNYVYIDITEYQAMISQNKHACKTFNIFCQIKSYMCMDNNCLHICYPSLKTLCKICGCSDNTLSATIKILYQNKLIYLYRFNDQERIKLNCSIEYVFALEQYNREQIIKEFAA
jgi:hypothetical protein